MSLKSRPLLFLLLLTVPFALVSAAIGGRKADLVGGWKPINDPKSKEVQEVAQFAVTEHNKEAGAKLKLESVVRGETQVVSGTNYRLVLTATDGADSGNYLTVVWVKPWLHSMNLTSFEKFVG